MKTCKAEQVNEHFLLELFKLTEFVSTESRVENERKFPVDRLSHQEN